MCGRAYQPRFLLDLAQCPHQRHGRGASRERSRHRAPRRPRGPRQILSAEEEENFKRPIREQYERQGHPLYATARLWDDGILDPADTRRALALALWASLNAPFAKEPYGVFRM